MEVDQLESEDTCSAVRRFQLVDVFSDGQFLGNPLAVVFDADDLSTETMQSITRWFNLSETVFLLRPTQSDADYRVRIFAPDREMPFAGHPTLGSCHAWLSAGGVPQRKVKIVQECGLGLVQIQKSDTALAFAAPPLLRSGPVDEAMLDDIAAFLGIGREEFVDAQWADNGPGWIAVLLKSASAVLDLKPTANGSMPMDIGVVGPYPDGSECAFELRALSIDLSGAFIEDPVTGSLNASIAQWLLSTGRAAAPYTASQGTCVERQGRVHIDQDRDGVVWVGGNATTVVEGKISI